MNSLVTDKNTNELVDTKLVVCKAYGRTSGVGGGEVDDRWSCGCWGYGYCWCHMTLKKLLVIIRLLTNSFLYACIQYQYQLYIH